MSFAIWVMRNSQEEPVVTPRGDVGVESFVINYGLTLTSGGAPLLRGTIVRHFYAPLPFSARVT